MLNLVLIGATIVLALSISMSLYRVFKGPSMPDRVIALDAIGIHLIAIVAVLSIWLNTQAYLEIILLLGILAFIGTIAFSKFIERGVVFERNRD